MSNEALIDRLRAASLAYPLDLFPPITQEERDALAPGIRERIAAEMGRHNSVLMLEAADALDDTTKEYIGSTRLAGKLGKLLTQTVNILRGPPADDQLWSTHDVPELVATLVKHNARLGMYAKLTQGVMLSLADSARMMLELHEMEERRASKEGGEDSEQEAGTEAGDVPDESLSGGAGEAAPR